jgi:hypothetical protein
MPASFAPAPAQRQHQNLWPGVPLMYCFVFPFSKRIGWMPNKKQTSQARLYMFTADGGSTIENYTDVARPENEASTPRLKYSNGFMPSKPFPGTSI